MKITGPFSPGWRQIQVSALAFRVAAEYGRFVWRLDRAASVEAPALFITGQYEET